MKAATVSVAVSVPVFRISIHAAREGGDVKRWGSAPATEISIHAAREGGDAFDGRRLGRYDISIHAAREGGDGVQPQQARAVLPFQSTPPVKAAT